MCIRDSQNFLVVISPQIFAEITRVLKYPRIQKRLDADFSDPFVEKLGDLCEWTLGELVLDILRQDPSDNIYLACAVEAQARYLVTGNRSHFLEAADYYRDISILTPRQFLAVLEADS